MIVFFGEHAYQNMFGPAVSSHCCCCTLIRCADNLDPHMNQCVTCTKVFAIQILMYPHVLEYSCCHFFVRRVDILFRIASTLSFPFFQRSCIIKFPFCSVASGVCNDGESLDPDG